jgi:hypothetical protein
VKHARPMLRKSDPVRRKPGSDGNRVFSLMPVRVGFSATIWRSLSGANARTEHLHQRVHSCDKAAQVSGSIASAISNCIDRHKFTT